MKRPSHKELYNKIHQAKEAIAKESLFSWTSRRFGCDTYFKFAFKEGRLWIVSLHEHREK